MPDNQVFLKKNFLLIKITQTKTLSLLQSKQQNTNIMIQIFTPTLGETKQDAFWYYGKEIATATLFNGNTLTLESSGEIEAYIFNNTLLKGDDVVKKAMKHHFCDLDLKDDNMITFKLNNWLVIREFKADSNIGPDDDIAICSNYSEGIEKFIEIFKKRTGEINSQEKEKKFEYQGTHIRTAHRTVYITSTSELSKDKLEEIQSKLNNMGSDAEGYEESGIKVTIGSEYDAESRYEIDDI